MGQRNCCKGSLKGFSMGGILVVCHGLPRNIKELRLVFVGDSSLGGLEGHGQRYYTVSLSLCMVLLKCYFFSFGACVIIST